MQDLYLAKEVPISCGSREAAIIASTAKLMKLMQKYLLEKNTVKIIILSAQVDRRRRYEGKELNEGPGNRMHTPSTRAPQGANPQRVDGRRLNSFKVR